MLALRTKSVSWGCGLIAVALALAGCGGSGAQGSEGGGGSGSGGGAGLGGAAVDGGPGGSGGVDSGSAWAAGRVQVTQSNRSTESLVTTYGVFSPIVPCTGERDAGRYCDCMDDVLDGCARRRCFGYYFGQLVTTDDLLGYGAIVADAQSQTMLSAGTLTVDDGARVLSYDAPYIRTDAVAAPWSAGQPISIAVSGADVTGFVATVPFPARVTFDALPHAPLPSSVEVRWTPAEGGGFVEATSAYKQWPDAGYSTTVIRCTAPVGAGQLTLPIAGNTSPGTPAAYSAVSVRVINSIKPAGLGRQIDVVVASFDTGPINDVPASPDGGGDASTGD